VIAGLSHADITQARAALSWKTVQRRCFAFELALQEIVPGQGCQSRNFVIKGVTS
jgi:hypothetical protein